MLPTTIRALVPSGLTGLTLLLSLSSCSLFGPSSGPAPTSRPSTTARKPAAPTGKVVDTKTYQRTYVPTVVRVARKYTGVPYRLGGNTMSGIDCSGLIYNVFQEVGLRMPRISWQQSEVGYEVDVNAIRPGDLLFFVPDQGKAGYVSHAAIVTEVRNYETDIRFIHASSSRGVREDNLYSSYFKGRFVKALRPF
ncbi:C40 family peptidase [Rudanella lutea]|uniref:C40 family peptidase n=1 Tax=Rudanella lutea TaxID=451374 RepID=UPI00039FE77F|nr:C40 family peptidase [Rudanella lutea]